LERDFDENIAAADNSNNVNGSQYKICKIWGFHGGDYDDYHLLGDDAVWLL
jgi:hypothetical protein